MATHDAYLEILQSFDYWQMPPGFDHNALEQHFLAFARELERACDTRLNVETGNSLQDAAFIGQIYLRGWLIQRWTAPHEQVLLRVSLWGKLATLSDEAAIHPDAMARIQSLLRQLGYEYIPPAVLAMPYTGAATHGIATWWDRYFDYH